MAPEIKKSNVKGGHMDDNMGVYELNGEIYEHVGEFLEALAHEYKMGDRDLVIQKLDEYGFDMTDLGVRPDGV